MHKIEDIVPSLPGWSSVMKCMRLYSTIVTNKPKITVEIGVFGGRGVLSMGLAHKEVGGICFGIDPYSINASIEGTNSEEDNKWWSDLNYEKLYRDVMIQILAHDLTKEINMLRMKSDSAAHLFKPNSIGLLVIDGNHSKEMCTTDIMNWAPKIASDGIILMDDLEWQGVSESYPLLFDYGFTKEEIIDDPAGSRWGIFKKLTE